MDQQQPGPSGLSLEEQRALLRDEQLRHVADLMESDDDELLVQALDEVERQLAVPMDDEHLHVTEHRQRLHDDRETFVRQNTPSFLEEAPAQVGGGGHFRFVLDPIMERRSAVMGVRERIFRTRLEQQGRLDSRRQNINHALAQGLRGAIETLLDDATIHDRDRVFLRFHSPRYDNSFSRGLRVYRWRQEPNTVTAFLDDLAQKLNSGEEYDPDEPFELEFVHVQAGPQGSGVSKNKRPGYEFSAHFRLNKKCIVNMPRDDAGLCCARAIVTARGLHLAGSNNKERDKWTRKCQRRRNEAAMALLEETGLQPGPMGLQELATLAEAPSLRDYRIVVVDANRQYACFAFGQGATLLALLHEDEHYDTLTSLPGFFGQSYFCGRCLKPYNQQGRHQCSEGKGVHCPGCQQNECDDYIEAYLRKRPAHIPCRHCRRQFYGDACFQLHQTKTLSGKAYGPNQSSVCDSWHKCASCRKLLRSMNEQDEHRCGYSECPSCHETTDLNQHQCFVQIPTDPEELEDRARIVQINKRTRLRREARNNPNTATEGGEEEEDNTYHPPLLVFWDTEAMQDTGVHVPNLVVGMTEEDALPHIFRGENCMEQFLQWLEQLTEQDTRYVTALAHNFKGYDSYFVVKRLIERKQKFKPTRTGGKLLELTYRGGYIRFIDSMSFFAMALASFTKTFGLDPDHFKKGYFPHLFNTPANADYVGPMPPREMYTPETMSTKGKAEFEQWHTAQVANEAQFDIQRDLVDYCISDVKLLREGCLTFRREFREQTGFCPFDKMTIAGACLHDYRLNRMEEETIASKPVKGWRLITNHSTAAMEWLLWQEHRLQEEDPLPNQRIQHARNQGEYRIPGRRWRVDGFDPDTNTVFEFLGCFWHGCLSCFPNRHEPYCRHDDRCMDDVRRTTMERLQSLRDLGYHVVTLWECEWEQQKKADPRVGEFVKTLPVIRPMNPRDAFFGGRTNASYLYYKVRVGEEIRYVDYTSLYPWVNKNGMYPIGHPEFMYEPGTTDLSEYFGLALCTIIPPKNLFHPVLPYRCGGKLTFPLCRTCVEQDIAKPLHEKSLSCDHTEDERALIGTWCTPELEKAVAMGYVIQHVHEVCHFEETRRGLFAEYVNTWLKIKVEASGWPSGCDTEEQRQAYVEDFERHEGIHLDPTKIAYNPGRRSLAKLMLNSLWGKFGQRDNLMQVKPFFDPLPFQLFMDSDQHDIRYVSCLDENWVEVHYRAKDECEELNVNTNVFIAAFTTCWARLRLYEALELLGKQVLYYDTDSVLYVHRPDQPDVTLGTHLGEFTNELKPGQYIAEFCSGGPKNYGYQCNDDKTECKVKGHSLNVEGMAQLNYEVLRQNTLDELQHPLETPRKTRIHQARKIIRKSKQYELRTQPAHKDYQLVFNKRILRPGTAITYPYGYCLAENDDADEDAHGFLSDMDAVNAHLLSGLLSDEDEEM